MFNWLAKFDERRSKLLIVALVVFVLLAGIFGTGVIAHLKQGGFADESSQSFQVQQNLEKKLQNQPGLIVLFSSPDAKATDPAFRTEVEGVLNKVKDEPSVASVATYYNTGAKEFISQDGMSTYAAITIEGQDIDAQLKSAKPLVEKLNSDQIDVKVGGLLAIQQALADQISEDLKKAELISFPILAVLLLIVFRSVVAALLPLLLGAVTVIGAFLVLRLIAQFTDLSVFALNIITVLGLGLAIDYSLFIVSRFREELRNFKGDKAKAIEKTLKTAGRTVFFSGVTVMVSLLGLLVFPLDFLRSMGFGGSAAVLVAMVSALTFLPAILYLLGNRVNAWSFGSAKRDNQMFKAGKMAPAKEGTTFWHSVPLFVMKRAKLMIVLVVVPLILAGLPFLRAEFNIPDYRSLPTDKDSYQVSNALATEFPNTTDAIQIVVKTPGNALAPQNINDLFDYAKQVQQVPGVTRVDSAVTALPGLTKADYQEMYNQEDTNPQTGSLAAQYAKDNYTLLNVRYDVRPDSDEARQIVTQIRALETPGSLTAQVGGTPAQLEDLLAVLAKYTPYALLFIVLTLFVLLFLMLGSVLIPIKAVLMNILALSASFGALVWIFQEGNLAGFFDFTSIGSIDSTQPILIFAIAFGLSMDYAVFLLSRIKEQYDKTGDTDKAIALGVEKTGPIITSAALLLFVVIAAFSTSEIPLMKQIGVGLGLALIIDAVIIRMVLVPASMHLLGKYNWWAPAPLKRFQKRLNLSE